MDYAKLKTEVLDDPLQRGFAAMTAQQIVDRNAIADITIQEAVSARQILRWAAATDGINALKTASASGNKDKRRLADASLALLSSPHVGDLDVADPEIAAMLAGMVALGVLTQAEVDSLKARGQKTISRWDDLKLGKVKPGHVEDVRR